MTSATSFVAGYVAGFNAAVAAGDYGSLLARFADDAVLRFENVPPEAASLEFAGRQAIADAYAQNPPDDQIDVTGEPVARGDHVTVPSAWRADQSAGVLDFVLSDGLISRLTVIFG